MKESYEVLLALYVKAPAGNDRAKGMPCCSAKQAEADVDSREAARLIDKGHHGKDGRVGYGGGVDASLSQRARHAMPAELWPSFRHNNLHIIEHSHFGTRHVHKDLQSCNLNRMTREDIVVPHPHLGSMCTIACNEYSITALSQNHPDCN